MNDFLPENSFSPDFAGTPWEMWGPELALWKKFQTTYQHLWISLWFNVRIGSGEEQPDHATETEIQYWRQITQRRIDVLIETDQDIIIVELRCNADKGTFGAAMLYRALWDRENKTEKNLRTMIVTNRMRDDMQKLCRENKIEVIILEEEK